MFMSLKAERDLNPTSRDQVKRAKTAAQSQNYDYAITLLQAALKDEPLYLDGRKLLRAVEIQKYKAMSAFTRQMAGMRLSGGLMKLSSKKTPEEQLIQAEEILAQDPYNVKANALIGEAGTVLGYPEFKCFAYETLRDGKPTDKANLNLLARAYMDSKESAKAVQTYEAILEIDKTDGDALSGLKNATAANAHVTGKWEEAEKSQDFRTSLKSRDESNQLEQEAKVVKSADAIQEQIDFNYQKHVAEPTNPNYSKKIGELSVQRNDYAGAIPWYEHAFASGGQTDSALEKTIGDLKLKKAEQELQALRQQLDGQADPELQAQTQTALAEKEKELNDVRLFQAEARVRAQPNEGEFRYDLGEALFKIEQYKRATEELQLSLKQPSVRYQALNLMGLAFMHRGMLDFAIKQLSLAQSELGAMDEIKKEVTYNLGLAYEAAKQSEKSLDQWKMIYEFDMSYRDVSARVEASYGGGGEGA
jgi:tetratricopeptide (TPR) repeat protein